MGRWQCNFFGGGGGISCSILHCISPPLMMKFDFHFKARAYPLIQLLLIWPEPLLFGCQQPVEAALIKHLIKQSRLFLR